MWRRPPHEGFEATICASPKAPLGALGGLISRHRREENFDFAPSARRKIGGPRLILH